MKSISKINIIIFFLIFISACQNSKQNITSFQIQSTISIQNLMPELAKLSSQCWTTPGKPFSDYRVSSELNSLSGQPRLLIVSKNHVQGLPALVVTGRSTGQGTQLSVFGPILSDTKKSKNITEQINAWAIGQNSC